MKLDLTKCVYLKTDIMKKILLLSIVLVFVFSCQDEIQVENFEPSKEFLNGISTVNGRLYFPSKEDFSREFDAVKDKSDVEIYEHVSKFYSKDFISLRPIVTDRNENEVYQKLTERKERYLDNLSIYRKTSPEVQSRNSEDDYLSNIDDLEDIIGDEAFASFLNSDAEIQVGNEIYKYTDVGLFVTTDYSKLSLFWPL